MENLNVYGDWGTSSLTLSIESSCGDRTTVTGKGVKFCGDTASYFETLIAPYRSSGQPVSALLAGMVGSNLGWFVTPYSAAPATLQDIAGDCVTKAFGDITVTLTPGVSGMNPFRERDVMRGEEVQIFGALELSKVGVENSVLVCMPGTHTKWVQCVNGKIATFFTFPRGEVWSALVEHSILLDRIDPLGTAANLDAFDESIVDALSGRWPDFITSAFGIRAALVTGDITPDVALGRFSGRLLGYDIKRGIETFVGDCRKSPIVVVGSDKNMELYSRALTLSGRRPTCIPSSDATMAGLRQIMQCRQG